MAWITLCFALCVVGSTLVVTGVPISQPPRILILEARFISLTRLKITWSLTPHNASSTPFQQQMALGESMDCDKRTLVNLTDTTRDYELVTAPKTPVTLCIRTISHRSKSEWSRRTVQPDIRWPPVIDTSTVPATPQLFIEEDPLGPVTCMASGYPKPTISWYKVGEPAPLTSDSYYLIRPMSGTLTIRDAQRHHEGSYYCVANNTYGRAIGPPVTYTHAYLGAFPTNTDSPHYTVDEYEHLKLECRSPPKSVPSYWTEVTWLRFPIQDGGQPEPVETSRRVIQAEDGSLLFVFTTEEDSGKYMCKVHNGYVDASKTGSEIIVTVKKKHVLVPRTPRLFSTPQTRHVTVWQNFTIQCIFSGSPLPSINWFRQGAPLAPSPYLVLSASNSSLTVSTPPPSRRSSSNPRLDGGQSGRHDAYQCQAQNSEGTSEMITTDVVYLDPPSFETAPQSVNASTGENVTFECVPQGMDHERIDWLINGVPVVNLERTKSKLKIHSRGSILHINDVTKDDVMVIQCNVSNHDLYIYTNAYLNVFDPPVIVNPPQDLIYSPDIEVYEFPCDVEGDPGLPLNVSWMFNGSLVHPGVDPHVFIHDSYMLRIDTKALTDNNNDDINDRSRGVGDNKRSIMSDNAGFNDDDDEEELSDNGSKYLGEYTCVGDNTVTTRMATAVLLVVQEIDPQTSPSIERGNNGFFHQALSDNLWLVVIVGLAVFVVVMLSGTMCVVLHRRNRKRPSGSDTSLSDMTHLSDINRNMVEAPTENGTVARYSNGGASCRCRTNSHSTNSHAGSAFSLDALVEDLNLRTTVQEVYVDRDRFELGELIGKGQFGRVYAALLFNSKGHYDDKVAVKTLKYKAEETEMVEMFLREAVMMKDFCHPHVLSLIGISFDCDSSPMVILPYMSNGDLKQHIQDPDREVTILELLKFGLQVAKGMVYLSQKRFVHRDLACRNCMVDEHEIVKVADFGLSRDLFSRDYYRIEDGKTPLPVRWMAPECLTQNVFTCMSDVWSFGILLWELMTRGAVPFPDLDNWDVPKHIKSGRHLAQPAFCPDAVYVIMSRCWAMNPHHRCTFEEIVTDITSIVQGAKAGVTDNNRNLYINIATAVVTRPDYRQTTV